MAAWLSKPARQFLLHLGISFFVTLSILLLTQDVLLDFPPLRRIESSLVDVRFQERNADKKPKPSSGIVIVAISQESFKALPEKWPWPRSYYTRLVRNLQRAGAKVIGIDIIFSTGDARNPAGDEEFRRTLRQSRNVVLAGSIEGARQRAILHTRGEQYGNVFIDSSSRIGMVNTREDGDGVLRRYMPFIYDDHQERRVPAFSFAVLNAWFDRPPLYTPAIDGRQFKYLSTDIPAYDPTSLLINYTGPSGTFRKIDIADVLDDKDFKTVDELNHPGESINTFDDPENGYLSDGTFAGKIVLVGSMTPEEKDLFAVPIGEGRQEGDNKMYGVEIHANVIQTILDQSFIIRQPFWMTALVVFGLSLSTFVLIAGLKSIRTKFSLLIEILGIAIMAAEIFIIYRASMTLFTNMNFLADVTSPSLAIVVSYIGSTVYSYVTERKQKVLIKSMFSRYVNPTIVDELVANPEKLRLGGERRELTVFFSDIENFTTISEKMPPEDLVTILNEYLSVMTSILFANNGTLDKYEGDAIVAFWGAPAPQTDHALRACRTALQMQGSLEGIRTLWRQEGKPDFRVRIGINTGEMIVGNMGGANRFDYTVMGDSVNLGSRLESANKTYRTNIMISEGTYRKVEGRVLARELDLIIVAGKTEPIRVYELLGMAENGNDVPAQLRLFTDQYRKGLALYRCREWQAAIAAFEEGLKMMPADYVSRMYIERSRTYLVSPPPAGWNGAFVMEKK